MAEVTPRIIIIGAGMAGILAGIKLKSAGIKDFTLYEKASQIGGTWRENTYPGLTCDVPSHHYTYTFERNPTWTRHLPPGPEVQAYFVRVFEKYGLAAYTQFEEELIAASYEGGQWNLQFASGHTDTASIVIMATGVLHHPKMPEIAGIDRFDGDIFHTARWDHSVQLEGRRVGVVGNGSTGVQIVSALAGIASKLCHFQRTAQWIMPVENGYFSEEQQRAFEDPEVLQEAMNMPEYLASVEAYTQALTDEDSEGAKALGDACRLNLEQSIVNPALREQLTPDHQPLCKRLIFSPDYYRAIQDPDASLVTAPIEAIEPEGIRTADGHLHKLDVIALATGFDARAFMRPMRICGRNGVTLEDLWSDYPKAYLAISMPDMPNLFMLNGPNGPVGNFSLIDIAEHQWDYIWQLVEPVLTGQAKEVSCSYDALAAYEETRSDAAKQTVWFRGGCQSWYLDSRGVPASWPWTYGDFVTAMESPDLSDFDLVS